MSGASGILNLDVSCERQLKVRAGNPWIGMIGKGGNLMGSCFVGFGSVASCERLLVAPHPGRRFKIIRGDFR